MTVKAEITSAFFVFKNQGIHKICFNLDVAKL